MNAIPTIAVTLLYLVPVALIALLLSTRRRRPAPWLIPVVLLALPVFYVGHYLLLLQLQGWPSSAPPPHQFRLLGFEIKEPDPGTGEAGRIFLWVNGVDDDQPRVHRLAYDKNLHQELLAAGQRQAEGRTQIGTRVRSAPSTSTGPDNSRREAIRLEDAKNRPLPAKQ